MKKTGNVGKKEYAVWIFVFAVFVFCLAWALEAPFDASPDESMRYQIVEFIAKHGSLPDGRDPEIRNANWGISYAFNPILPYMAGAVLVKIVQLFTASFRATVIAARMVNVLLGGGMAWFTWKIGELMFRRKEAGRFLRFWYVFFRARAFCSRISIRTGWHCLPQLGSCTAGAGRVRKDGVFRSVSRWELRWDCACCRITMPMDIC